jgi:NIMA (never in mitosis gene a)-related kinase
MGLLTYKSSQFIHREKYTDKTDLWSFGCILYEMLTLRRAYEGETVRDMMDAVIRNEIEPLDPSEPKEFTFILERLLFVNLGICK